MVCALECLSVKCFSILFPLYVCTGTTFVSITGQCTLLRIYTRNSSCCALGGHLNCLLGPVYSYRKLLVERLVLLGIPEGCKVVITNSCDVAVFGEKL